MTEKAKSYSSHHEEIAAVQADRDENGVPVKDTSCKACIDPLYWFGGDEYRCALDGCERKGITVDRYGMTPEEANNYEGSRI